MKYRLVLAYTFNVTRGYRLQETHAMKICAEITVRVSQTASITSASAKTAIAGNIARSVSIV